MWRTQKIAPHNQIAHDEKISCFARALNNTFIYSILVSSDLSVKLFHIDARSNILFQKNYPSNTSP